MYTVRIREKGGDERTLTFDQEEVSIGRGKNNDIVLPRGNVSKRHARIVHKDDKFIVVDLRSTNGTYFNARKISSPVIVSPQDKVYVGDFVISVASGDGVVRPPTAPQPVVPPPAPPRPATAPGIRVATADVPASSAPPVPRETKPLGVVEAPEDEVEIVIDEGAGDHEEVEIPMDLAHEPPSRPSVAPVAVAAYDDFDEPTPPPGDFRPAVAPAAVVPRPSTPVAPAPVAATPAAKPAAPVEKPAAPVEKPAAPVEKPAAPVVQPAAAKPSVSPGLASLEPFWADPRVTEVIIAASDAAFLRVGSRRERIDLGFSAAEIAAMVDEVLGALGRPGPGDAPFVEGELSPGIWARVVLPPFAADGPLLQFERAAPAPATLVDLVVAGALDEDRAAALEAAVVAGRHVLVVGPSWAVRAPLMAALSAALAPEGFVVAVSDGRPVGRVGARGVSLQTDGRGLAADGFGRIARLGADALVIDTLSQTMLPGYVGAGFDAAPQILAGAWGKHPDDFLRPFVVACQALVHGASKDDAEALVARAFDVVVFVERAEDDTVRVSRVCRLAADAGGRLALVDL